MKLIALVLVVFLGACGGGGDAQVIQPEQVLAVGAPSTCVVAPEITGETFPHSQIASNVHAFASAGDLSFTGAAFSNQGPSPLLIQVVLTSQRRLDVSQASGPANLDLLLEIVDGATGTPVEASHDGCEHAIVGLAAGGSAIATETRRINFVVQPGQAVLIRSTARTNAGGTVLTTTSWDLTLVQQLT